MRVGGHPALPGRRRRGILKKIIVGKPDPRNEGNVQMRNEL